jgi:hypothetical protein
MLAGGRVLSCLLGGSTIILAEDFCEFGHASGGDEWVGAV